MPDNNNINLNNVNKPNKQFALTCIFVFLIYTVFIYISGYFEIGLMSDDYLNFVSSVNSDLKDKFTSGIRDYSVFHFRPLWFLSMELSIYLNGLLNFEYDNFIFFRAENMILFFALAYLSAVFVFRITKSYFYSVLILMLILVYPNNNISIFWSTGKVDLLCGLFIISALLMTQKYLVEKSLIFFISVQLFFVLALLTKETATVTPFLTLIIFILISGKKFDSLKRIFLSEILILIIYFAYRLFLLSNKVSGVFTIYGDHGIINYFTIIIKAFISLIIPFDYLTLQNGVSGEDLFVLISVLFFLIFGIYILYKLIKTNKIRGLLTVCLLFLLILIPNLIAGYFRPQLILIPFIFVFISVFSLLSKHKVKFSLMFSAVILLMFCYINFINIKDWKYGYRILRESVAKILEADLKKSEMNYVIGLPSRYKSVFIDDYVTGPYNYFKYKEFIVNDRNIVDFIHSGALDKASLNSDLKYKITSDRKIEIETTGETQYLMKLDIVSDVFRDENSELIFSGYNKFNKPVKAVIRILPDSARIFIYSGGILKFPEQK